MSKIILVNLRGRFSFKRIIVRILLIVVLWGTVLSGMGNTQAVPEPNFPREPNVLEDAFWELVNRFRENPFAVSQALGIDIPEHLAVYIQSKLPLPPFAWNQAVYEALCEHVEDMVEVGYYSLISPDGVAVEDRLEQRNYFPLRIDASLGLFSFQTVVAEETVLAVFLKSIIEEELRLLSQGTSKLLSRDFRDIGICFYPAQLDNIVGFPVNGYVFGLLFSTNVNDFRPAIVGRVYHDENANGRWDFGEGVDDVKVYLIGEDASIYETPILTGEGIFSFVTNPGSYFIEVWRSDRRLYQGDALLLGEDNIRVDVAIQELDEDNSF